MLLNKVRWLFHFFGHHISQRCLRPRHVALVTASFPTSATADGRLPLGWANSARSEPDETAGLARSNHGNLEHQRWKFKLLRPSFWSCSLCDGYIFPRSKAVAGHFLLFSRKKKPKHARILPMFPPKKVLSTLQGADWAAGNATSKVGPWGNFGCPKCKLMW